MHNYCQLTLVPAPYQSSSLPPSEHIAHGRLQRSIPNNTTTTTTTTNCGANSDDHTAAAVAAVRPFGRRQSLPSSAAAVVAVAATVINGTGTTSVSSPSWAVGALFFLPKSTSKVKFMIKAAMATAAVCVYIVALVLCQNVHGYPNMKATAHAHEHRPKQQHSLISNHHQHLSKRPNQLDAGTENPFGGVSSSAAAATGTPKPPTTTLNDVFISVKTTKRNHDSRLDLVLNTWHQLARHQTWFFTDEDDKVYQDRTNGHMVNTNCSNSHLRRDLCCKMSTEFDTFLESRKKWFCHFDDDNYVNVPRLVSLLNEYSPSMEWYLGKPSVASPLEIHLDYKKRKSGPDSKVRFWFATGGAGFCISRALALRMSPIAGGGKLISIGDRIRFPDDVTVGFIIEHLLKVPLTVVEQFHSHLEPMEYIAADTFRDQVSFSYGRIANDWNVISLDGYRSKTDDPTRFHSLHCHLFPYLRPCSR